MKPGIGNGFYQVAHRAFSDFLLSISIWYGVTISPFLFADLQQLRDEDAVFLFGENPRRS